MKAAVCGLTLLATSLIGIATLLADEEKIPLEKVPKSVIDSVKKRFPNAELTAAEKEVENGKTNFEIKLKNNGQSFEIELTPEGSITEIEKRIDAKDLPKAVTDALEVKYPKATHKKIVEVTKVQDGSEKLDGYEIVVLTAEKKKLEVSVTADGKISKEEAKGSEKK
jgi:hypothetical protein